MNKYVALVTAALTLMSTVAVAGADHDGKAVETIELGEDTYYVHDSGVYKETNTVHGLQTTPGQTMSGPFEPDEQAHRHVLAGVGLAE